MLHETPSGKSAERKLSGFEHALTLSNEFAPLNIVGVMDLEPAPGPETLRSALDALAQRHPYLTVHITRQGSHYRYRKQGTPEIPLLVKHRIDAQAWQRFAEEELNRRIDSATGPLVRCLLLTDLSTSTPAGNFAQAELIFTCHHAILDGVSLLALFREFLAHCAGIMKGELPEERPTLSAALPVEQLLPPRFRGLRLALRTVPFLLRQMLDELGYRLASRGAPRAPINKNAKCKLLVRQIASTRMRRLTKAARTRRVTVNSVLGAALLLAVHKHLYADHPTILRTISFADLRPYLCPPVPAQDLGCYVAMTRISARLTANKPLWILAEELGRDTYQAAKRGEKFIAGSMSKQMMRFILRLKNMRMGTTALSFGGAVSLEPPGGEIRVKQIHGLVSNMVLGPQFTAQARLHRGNLVLDYLYLDTDMDRDLATTIANEVETLLAAAVP